MSERKDIPGSFSTLPLSHLESLQSGLYSSFPARLGSTNFDSESCVIWLNTLQVRCPRSNRSPIRTCFAKTSDLLHEPPDLFFGIRIARVLQSSSKNKHPVIQPLQSPGHIITVIPHALSKRILYIRSHTEETEEGSGEGSGTHLRQFNEAVHNTEELLGIRPCSASFSQS